MSSFLRLVPANQLPAKREEQAGVAETPSVPRRNAQFAGDLAERQSKSTKALHGHEAVQAPVPVRIGTDLVHMGKLAIAPRSSFRQHAFDESPRTLKLLR